MSNLGNVGFGIGGESSAYQPLFSGGGTISGTLKQSGTDCNAQVFIVNEQFNEIVDFVTSFGTFSFPGLKTTQSYTVIAQDMDSSSYNKKVYKGVVPV